MLNVFGSVEGAKAGEIVTVQAKDRGKDSFRVVDGAVTREGGGWSTDFIPAITTTVRAVWNETASAQITVRQRITVYLSPRVGGGGFWVAVNGKGSFWRKRVVIQRFDRRLGRWATIRSVVLTETGFHDSRRRPRIHAIFVRFWDANERIYATGVAEPGYTPNPALSPRLERAGSLVGGRVFVEDEPGHVRDAAERALSSGPRRQRELRGERLALMPYVTLAAFLPLAFLLWRRNL